MRYLGTDSLSHCLGDHARHLSNVLKKKIINKSAFMQKMKVSVYLRFYRDTVEQGLQDCLSGS